MNSFCTTVTAEVETLCIIVLLIVELDWTRLTEH